jgi:hypothetical protein
MPRHTTLDLTARTWTQLTDADVTAITFQNIGGHFILVKATTDTTTPTTTTDAIRYNPGQGERNALMTNLFPGLSGADRVWAWAESNASVYVSHL